MNLYVLVLGIKITGKEFKHIVLIIWCQKKQMSKDVVNLFSVPVRQQWLCLFLLLTKDTCWSCLLFDYCLAASVPSSCGIK